MIGVRTYSRVSTTKQKEDGVSIETQQVRMKEYCDRKGYTIVKHYKDEARSGRSADREGLLQMLDDLQEGEIVIVYQLSRFSRSMKDAIDLIDRIQNKKKATFECLDPPLDLSNAFGRALFHMVMTFHQLERENLGKLTSDAMLRLSEQKALRGRPPFGYKCVGRDKDYVKDDEKFVWVEKIIERHKMGEKIHRIATWLNEQQTEKKWGSTQVKAVLIAHGVIPDEKGVYHSIEERLISYHKE
jgi:site-specific DNA recombinase